MKMKYLKLFEDYNDDLKDFHKNLMNKIKTKVEIENNYGIKNINEIKALIDKYILTDDIKSLIKKKYKVEIGKTFLRKKIKRSTQYHNYIAYDIVDTILPRKQNFVIDIEIEIPIGEEFIDNTMLSLSIYIHPQNRRKDFFELFNRRIDTDQENNYYKLGAMIQGLGKEIHTKLM